MTTNQIKLSTATYKELFGAIRSIMQDLKHAVVKDRNRRSVPIMNLVQMVDLYIVQSSDNVRPTRTGDWSLKGMVGEDFLQTRSTWEKLGIAKNNLPNLLQYDANGNEYEAYMTMNGLMIDPDCQQFKRRMLNLSTYPSSIIHEKLGIVGAALKKYIRDDDVVQIRSQTCIFDELEKLQHAKIVMQNALFAQRQEITNQIKETTSTIVTTRGQAIAMKETLQLNLAMLDRAECKLTGSSDQEIVMTIIKNFCDAMKRTEFRNITEKIELSNVLISFRKEKEYGQDIGLDHFLNQIVDVFKHNDADDDTLHAALMAVDGLHDERRPEPRARYGSGGAQPKQNTHHVETASLPNTDQESKVMGMVLKALNDLKSDMGTVKKILDISDGTKTGDTAYPKHKKGYRVSEQREKTKGRFAGAIAKGPKVKRTTSVPQPLTARTVSITQSDSDSEQSAQFAGIQQQYKSVDRDYRILSADRPKPDKSILRHVGAAPPVPDAASLVSPPRQRRQAIGRTVLSRNAR